MEHQCSLLSIVSLWGVKFRKHDRLQATGIGHTDVHLNNKRRILKIISAYLLALITELK